MCPSPYEGEGLGMRLEKGRRALFAVGPGYELLDVNPEVGD